MTTALTITIETSCGQTFETDPRKMSVRQLKGLLEQNGDRTDIDPAEIAALRDELARREQL
jgi:hypothetical protein